MSNASALEQAQAIAARLEEIDQHEEPGTCWEFIDDALDVRRTYSSDGELLSVSLLLTYGGPTVWADFDPTGATVRASWYSEEQRAIAYCAHLSDVVLEAFNTWTVTR